jgi:hypothetical protein
LLKIYIHFNVLFFKTFAKKIKAFKSLQCCYIFLALRVHQIVEDWLPIKSVLTVERYAAIFHYFSIFNVHVILLSLMLPSDHPFPGFYYNSCSKLLSTSSLWSCYFFRSIESRICWALETQHFSLSIVVWNDPNNNESDSTTFVSIAIG